MGNSPSTSNRPQGQTPLPPYLASSKIQTSRKDPRNLINSQRTAAAAEASLAQARGTTTHRSRHSQSHPANYLNQSSPSQSIDSPSVHSNESHTSTQIYMEDVMPDQRDRPSKPVDVPVHHSNLEYSQSIEPSGPAAIQEMSYHLTRPPRLPLPIEQEVHTPGSPILATVDDEVPPLDVETLDGDTIQRKTSALSTDTIEEEDAEELRVDKTKATVPTRFEWLQGGDKVYVTGTIFQWNKKHRLHSVEGEPGISRATIHVRPGTHHVRFIVDGVMQCSTHLPTTVDFGNNLVNYIEVSADDLPHASQISEHEAVALNPESELKMQTNTTDSDTKATDELEGSKPALKTKPVLPPSQFYSQIPQYLLDLDKPEDSRAYQHAAAAIEKLPTPPSLPGFLGKPILNAATPMKDDNSVLTMPNHTVLNHLGTSSIKNNVLAVSVTTRYKLKYVTVIMYKPTGDD